MNTQNDRHREGAKPRLLQGASEVFARKGYSDATIAEICRLAETNIAAVNYYFRSKENLYVQAWRLSFHRSLAAHPTDGGVPADAPPQQRLAGQIRSLVQRITDPKSHEFDIVCKEQAKPTGLLKEVMRESIQPIRRQMGQVVRELLGSAASEQQVELSQMSIMAQCLHTMIRERHRTALSGENLRPPYPHFDSTVEEMTEHIIRFSLAGIQNMRQQTKTDIPQEME